MVTDLEIFIDAITEELENNSIESISAGGCGIFSYLMTYHLRRCGYFAKIVCIHHDSDNEASDIVYRIGNCMDNKYMKPKPFGVFTLSANHFAIECNDILFDNSGVIQRIKGCHGKIVGYYTLSDMRVAISKGRWNSWYDKRDNKRINDIIKANLTLL